MTEANKERDAIVKWLRAIAKEPPHHNDTGQAKARELSCNFFADVIERGDHLKETK